ncbi:MAG: glucose 1-dehydrogenase [Sphingobium sp.]
MGGMAIVTGAGRGIGAATARLLGQRGFAVCVNYLGRADTAQAVVDDIIGQGGRAVAIQADMASADDIERLFGEAEAALGPVTALVNNAGLTGRFGRLHSFTAEQIERIMDVNVNGAILCAAAAVRRMSTRNGGAGGAIVNISSMSAISGGARNFIPYAASKGAMNTLTIGLAREFGPDGIRVNAILPGLIPTDLHGPEAQETLAPMIQSIPLRRLGTSEDCAKAVHWLLSDESAYVTGAIIPVAGGM